MNLQSKNIKTEAASRIRVYDKSHIIMSLRKNGFFTPRLQPGEQKQPKTKGLQPLKGLNAKATKNAEKDNHRAKAPVKKE